MPRAKIVRLGDTARLYGSFIKDDMAAYPIERERFIVAMQAEGMAPEITRRILRHAATVQRCAVAECNGDGPTLDKNINVDIAQRKRERAEQLIWAWCAKANALAVAAAPSIYGQKMRLAAPAFVPVFGGDLRGCCVKLRVPSGRTDDGNHEGMCVPTRRY